MAKVEPYKELNLVIVGSKSSQKGLICDIILGTRAFNAGDDTFDNERREGEACERRVILVKSPSWLRGYHLCDTPELIKTEMILSPALAPPGPHAFILVINAEQPFKDVNRRATKEHLQHCFGERVWDHTIVVFSYRGSLSQRRAQGYITEEGAPLQSLLETCGNRYHFLCEDNTDRNRKVRELLEDVATMVSQRGCYKASEKLVKDAEKRRTEVGLRAEELRQQSDGARKQRRTLVVEPKPPLGIMLVGWVFSGKSATGNSILKDEKFHFGERTMNVIKKMGTVAGRTITIADTPGWWKYFPADYTPAAVKSEIKKATSLCSPSPNVFLLAVPLDTSFTAEQKRVIDDNMRLFGPRVWRHTILLFTFGDSLGKKTIEQHIESEGKPLHWLVEKCEKRYHVINNRSKDDNQVTELLEKMEEMVAGNSSFYHSETPDPLPETKRSKKITGTKDMTRTKEISQQLNVEWNRRNWEYDYIQRDDSSKYSPLNFSGSGCTSKSSKDKEAKVSQSQDDDQRNVSLYDGSEDSVTTGSLKIMADLLEREWSRREASMEFCYDLSPDKRDVSEPDVSQLQKSREKVLWWLKTQQVSGCKADMEVQLGKRKRILRSTGRKKKNPVRGTKIKV